MKSILCLRFEHPEQLKECLTNYGVANGYQHWYRRNDYQNLIVLCGRDIAEGRCGGKKGKAEGVQIESPSKGNKGKKGVQSPGKKGKKGVHSSGKKGKGVESTVKKGKGVESTGSLVTYKWIAKQGLMEAVRTMLPYVEHRQCARHIYTNFKKKWNGLHYKFLFWGAAGSTIQHQF
ncbi:hypothetical protein Tco_1013224, partial [Tanacetum coccineum]